MDIVQYVKLDDVLSAIDECRCSDCSNEAPLPCSLCQFRDVYKKVIILPVINNIPEQDKEELVDRIASHMEKQWDDLKDAWMVCDRSEQIRRMIRNAIND